MKLKPYPEYKDSGVPWLGEVPAHWEVRRTRNVIDLRVSNVDKHSKEGELPVRLCNYVDVYKNDRITENVSFMRGTATAEEIERFRLEHGDVLITKDSEAWNDIGIPALIEYPTEDLVCGYHLALLRPRKALLSGAYLLRALQSPALTYQFHIAANGVTRYGLSHDAIRSVLLPIPLLSEQAAIVSFLDHVDRRINRLIRAKRRLIALLNEQKQVIIHRAVTRGLDQNVRLRSSGLDWLGDVPEHWEIRRNGQLFTQRNETGFINLPILEVSLRTGVRVRDFENSNRKQVLFNRAQYKRAAQGDIAYNMMRMWQGAVGVAPVDGLVSPAYVVAKPLKGTEPRFCAYLFRTPEYMAEGDKYSRGIVKDRNRLYWEDFKQMPAPCPPFSEQVQIADVIEVHTQAINYAIDLTEHEIDLIRDYRTRLIADVVTGKLDVREAAAQIPEEADEPEPLEEVEALLAEDSEAEEETDLDAAAVEVGA